MAIFEFSCGKIRLRGQSGMKLFDMSGPEKRELRRAIAWHLVYLAVVAAFFWIIYYFGYFKSHPFLRDKPLFTVISPLVTLVFVIISPWRGKWFRAVVDTYNRLEGSPGFCLMGALVFIFGFYLYSVLLWGLAALGPSLFYM